MFTSFKQAAADQGFTENETVEYLHDGPLGSPGAADAAAEKLAARDLDLIFTVTTFLGSKIKTALEKKGKQTFPCFSPWSPIVPPIERSEFFLHINLKRLGCGGRHRPPSKLHDLHR